MAYTSTAIALRPPFLKSTSPEDARGVLNSVIEVKKVTPPLQARLAEVQAIFDICVQNHDYSPLIKRMKEHVVKLREIGVC